MDVAFQKSFFVSDDFQNELTSPIFASDETLNHTIRWIFETKLYLLTIALISFFNLIVHLLAMVMWYDHGEMGYFGFALCILLLNSCGNSVIMSKYLIANSDMDSNRLMSSLWCCLCLPFALLFPYILMLIPQRYFTQIDDVDDSERTTSEHRLFTKKNRKFVSLIIQGYTQGIPQSILMTIYLYHMDNQLIKLNLLSSVLLILQSLFMWKLTKYLDTLYNIINIVCAVIDVLLIYIMILYYYRSNAPDASMYDRMIFTVFFINSVVGISFIFVFILSYIVLMQCTMTPLVHGCAEFLGFFCCMCCFVLIPYPVIAALILITCEVIAYSWIIIFVRMFCVGNNWKFIQFIVGTHLPSLDKQHTIYRLYHVNHMLTADGKTDIDTDQFEKYLNATYEENKFVGIDSLHDIKQHSWHEKASIIDKYYNDYVYGVLGVDASNGSIYKHHKPFTAVLIMIYFVSRVVKLLFPLFALIGVLMDYNHDETNDLLLYILSIEMLLIIVVLLLFAVCCKQIYYGFHVIYSTPHNKIKARSYIQFLATHRVLAGIIKNDDIARIIILYCGHLQKIIPNCPGKHGLSETQSGGFHMCDICRQTVTANDTMYSCRKCDFDVCQECFCPSQECYSTKDESTSPLSPVNA